MIAAMLLSLAQPSVAVEANPGAPEVPGVGFRCSMVVDGEQFTMSGTAPTYPEEHPASLALPLMVSTSVATKYSGKRWMWLGSTSDNHRSYRLEFRFDDEPTIRLSFVLLKDNLGLGVLEQMIPYDSDQPKWPLTLLGRAQCTSDWTPDIEGEIS